VKGGTFLCWKSANLVKDGTFLYWKSANLVKDGTFFCWKSANLVKDGTFYYWKSAIFLKAAVCAHLGAFKPLKEEVRSSEELPVQFVVPLKNHEPFALYFFVSLGLFF